MRTRLFRRFAAAAGSVALVTLSSPAYAAVITFDDTTAPALFSEAQPLTTQYSALGVTFSGTGAVLDGLTSDFMVTGYSSPNLVAYLSEAFIGPLSANITSEASDVITFSTPLSGVSFLAGSGLPLGMGRTLDVRAFAGTMMVDSESLELGDVLQMVSLTGMGITSVSLRAMQLFEDEEGVNFVIDNLNTTPAQAVPEPMTLVLLGSGLMGAALSQRRRRGRL